MNEQSFTTYQFGRQEQPPYTKFNNIIRLLEEQRLINGGYKISFFSSPTASSASIIIEETDSSVGGYALTGSLYFLNRKFSAEYRMDSGPNAGWVRWENIRFDWHNSSGVYYATLDNSNRVYPRNQVLGNGGSDVNLSGSTISGFKLFAFNEPMKTRWGTQGTALELLTSGGNVKYLFITEANILRLSTTIPTSDSSGSAV